MVNSEPVSNTEAHLAQTKHPPGPAMTLGNMRELGVRANERFPAPNASKWSGFSIGLLR